MIPAGGIRRKANNFFRMEPKTLLENVEIFQQCPQAEIEIVLHYATRRNYPASTTIARQGDLSLGLCLLLRGSVKIVFHHDDGRELVLAILRQNEAFGEMSLIDDEPLSATIE